MSKARKQSLKRSLVRANKGRENKKPRIITEFVDTLGKLFILKRPNTGHNKVMVSERGKTLNKRPYYNVIGGM